MLHLISDKNGALSISGLETGSYRLKEAEAPSGCVLGETETPLAISILLSGDKKADSMLKVVNKKEDSHPLPPKTSETKNTLLGVVGMVSASFAVWLFVKRRTKVKKREIIKR